MPGNSFVKYVLAESYDVYLLDWGISGLEDKNLSSENYILDYLDEAVERVLKSSSAEEYTLFGHCMGGTISAVYASLFLEKRKNLILLATPINFAPEDPRLPGLWTFLVGAAKASSTRTC